MGLPVLRSMMLKVWKVDNGVTFKSLGANLFVVIFMNAGDRDRVLAG